MRGLWLCTVWASAASVDPAVTAMEGGVGMIATFGGLVLLAVLLTTISDRETRVGNQSVDEQNPAPGDMVNTGNIQGFIYPNWVWDVHQQKEHKTPGKSL